MLPRKKAKVVSSPICVSHVDVPEGPLMQREPYRQLRSVLQLVSPSSSW